MKTITLILVVSLMFFCLCNTKKKTYPVNTNPQSENAQNFYFISLENESCNLLVLPDHVNNILKIKLMGGDSVCFRNFTGFAEEIKVQNNKFLSVNFSVRSGTGVKQARYTELCVSLNKLYIPIDVYSVENYEFNQTYDSITDAQKKYDGKSNFTFKTFRTKDSFRLNLEEHYSVKSKADQDQNFQITDTINLSFDKEKKVFFDTIDYLKGIYKIYQGKGMESKIFLNENCHVINMKNSKYYYISNSWYYMNKVGDLIGLLNECDW